MNLQDDDELTKLVTEHVCGPDAGNLSFMDGINESEAILLREQSWGHAGPQGEDYKGNEVASSKSPPASLVELSRSIVVEPCEEKDRSWNMDEAGEPVSHQYSQA